MKPIYDTWNLSYKSIFGAIEQFQDCQFTIRLPEETPLDFSPVLVVFRTGFKERFLPMNVKEHENGYVTYTNTTRATAMFTTIIFPILRAGYATTSKR